MDLNIMVGATVSGQVEGIDQDMSDAVEALEGYTQYPKWVEKSKVERVRNLKCFETIREMLINCLPTVEVARQVLILGEMTGSTVESVRVYLEHYKQTIPKTLMIARINPMQYVETKKKVDETLDSLYVMNQLTEKMMKRIDIAMQREQALGFLMNNVEKQFAVCMELASRMYEMKKELGVTNEQAQEVMNKAAAVSRVDWDKTYSKPGLNEVMGNPESRNRVVRFLEDMTGLFGKMPKDQQDRILKASTKANEEKK